MIKASDFNLTYFSKDDGREVKVKRVTKEDYIVLDRGSIFKLSNHRLRCQYRPCKNNKGKRRFIQFGRGFNKTA